MGLPKAVKEMEDKVAEMESKAGDTVEPTTPEEEASNSIPNAEQEKKPETDLLEENKRLKDAIKKKEDALNTLRGKYDAEVPRLSEKVRELEGLISSSSNGNKADTSNAIDELSKLREDYGDEFISDLDKYFEKKFANMSAPIRNEINNVSSTARQGAVERFFSILDSEVPNWRVVKEDEGFLRYLGQADQFSGKTLQELAEEAQDNLDGARVAHFYKSYLATKGEARKPRENLESLVSPSGNSDSSNVGEGNEEFVTMREMEAFYNDVRRGKFLGRDDEMKKIEAKINSLVAQGKVLP